MIKLLEKINSPEDVKKLTDEEADLLCGEIRELIIQTVSENGGHLASNLGTVELSVALHRVFAAPGDQIVFDVGHQSYTHKILTGRRKNFGSLRQEGGISGFTRPCESGYDLFSSGHSSVSVSQALGLAKAKELRGETGKVVAVIGDGALTGGLAYEGLNNVNMQNKNLVVILNDNKMSIAKNVGLVPKHLTSVRTSKNYFVFRSKIRRTIAKAGNFGKEINKLIALMNTAIRKRIYKNSTFFEDLGFRYYGPIDGHDMKSLMAVLETAKAHNHPVFIDVVTVKGKGYAPAETNPTRFHGIGKFDMETGRALNAKKTFSDAFGSAVCSLAEKDSKICCITAAMAYGTGLEKFAKKFPKRFFDVGIAEQHAVTFASGLARGGFVPVFAVYSTFLQRSYDQLIHDCAMQRLKIIFAIDRAGFVGEDGESHQGLFDVSYLNTVPDLTVYSPACFAEVARMLGEAVYSAPGAAAVRYPRGTQGEMPENYKYDGADFTTYGAGGEKNVILTYGREFCECYKAYKKLGGTALIKLNKIKPLNPALFAHLGAAENIYFYEESIKSGGVGEEVGAALAERGVRANYKITAVDTGFVKEAGVARQLQKYGLDCESIIKEVANGKDKA